MYNSKKIQNFLLSNWDWETEALRSKNVFVYSENLDKIISLANHSYNYEPDKNISGVTFKAGAFQGYKNSPLYIFWTTLESFLNITFKIKMYTDVSNYMSSIATGDIDIGLISTLHINELSALPLLRYGAHIKMKSLTYQQSSTYFLDVFSTKLWLAFFVSTFIFILIAISIVKISNWIKKDYGEQVIQTISPMLGQGIQESSTKNSYRILLLLICIMSIFFGIAFSTFLTAQLSIRRYRYPFDDLDGLLTNKTYSLCAPEMALVIKDLDNRPMSLNKAHCPKMNRYEFDENLLCAIDNIALLTTTYLPKKNDKICELTVLPVMYYKHYISPPISANFEYKKTINVWFIKMKSNGVRNRMQRQLNKEKYFNPRAIDDFQPVEFDSTVWILVGYIVLIIAAISILIVEIFIKRIQ